MTVEQTRAREYQSTRLLLTSTQAPCKVAHARMRMELRSHCPRRGPWLGDLDVVATRPMGGGLRAAMFCTCENDGGGGEFDSRKIRRRPLYKQQYGNSDHPRHIRSRQNRSDAAAYDSCCHSRLTCPQHVQMVSLPSRYNSCSGSHTGDSRGGWSAVLPTALRLKP